MIFPSGKLFDNLKYLIVGLGNVGEEYEDTRHNIGFLILDAFARDCGVTFSDRRYGFIGNFNYKGRKIYLLKPSTFMNLSGNAVNYWMKKEKIEIGNLLVIVDDLALPLGTIRMRPKGRDGGHNGLSHISSVLGTNEYARIRFGIGNSFGRGKQKEYVLSSWTPEEKIIVEEKIPYVIQMIKSFVTEGTDLTMTRFNNHAKVEKTTDKKERGKLHLS